MSTTAWTTSANGASCGSTSFCNGGQCTEGCEIAGTFYVPGASNPSNACEVCTPTTSATGWSPANDGTACGTGKVCSLGVCSSGCYIQHEFVSNGASEPGNACQVCNSTASTTAWTNAPNLTACEGTAGYCIEGTCENGCNINGVSYAPGASNPNSPCEVCSPKLNPDQWTSPCTSCGGGVCTIDCTGPGPCATGQDLLCPSGVSCVVECSAPQSCTDLTISSSGPMNVECSGTQSCLNSTIECLGGGTCSVECTGAEACEMSFGGGPMEQGLICGTGACTATCSMENTLSVDCGESSSCMTGGCNQAP